MDTAYSTQIQKSELIYIFVLSDLHLYHVYTLQRYYIGRKNIK